MMDTQQLLMLLNSMSDEQKREFASASKATLKQANSVPSVSIGEKGGLVFRNVGGARSPHLWAAQYAAMVSKPMILSAIAAIETKLPAEQAERLTAEMRQNLVDLKTFASK